MLAGVGDVHGSTQWWCILHPTLSVDMAFNKVTSYINNFTHLLLIDSLSSI